MRKSIGRQQILWAVAMFVIPHSFPQDALVQQTFSSPDQAVGSLVDALRAGDQQQLRNILGSSESKLLSSGVRDLPIRTMSPGSLPITTKNMRHQVPQMGT